MSPTAPRPTPAAAVAAAQPITPRPPTVPPASATPPPTHVVDLQLIKIACRHRTRWVRGGSAFCDLACCGGREGPRCQTREGPKHADQKRAALHPTLPLSN